MKKQNPIAKDLRTPKYKPRVIKDKTKYDRKVAKRKSFADAIKRLHPSINNTGIWE